MERSSPEGSLVHASDVILATALHRHQPTDANHGWEVKRYLEWEEDDITTFKYRAPDNAVMQYERHIIPLRLASTTIVEIAKRYPKLHGGASNVAPITILLSLL